MKIKYISFDIYDTLIKRIIPVDDLYDLIEKQLNNKYSIKIKNFKTKRKEAENIAKNKVGNNYDINDIYNYFPSSLSKKDITKIINLEKEYEIKCSVINYEGFKLYNKYKDKYKIICISDMYLDCKTIQSILKHNGYDINRIYVSCEENKSKKEFNLYTKVLNDLKISKDEILHIGDAKRSDFINPKLLGIKSKLIKTSFINNDNYYYDIGFNLFGPLMYEFCHFIKDNIKEDSNILFVSREGEFFKECFNTLYPDIKTNMIYLSRKSVTIGTSSILLEKITLEELIKYISVKRNETILDFFNRLGLNPNKYESKLKKENINLDNLLYSVNLDFFFTENKKDIIKDLKSSNLLFNEYLNNSLKDNNTLVDIGWKGSMQNLLSKYLELTNSKKNINGLYLGVMDNKNKKGFLFNKNNNICQNVLNYSGLLEIIFMPNYGSVIGYKKENKKIIPIFDKVEFTSKSLEIIKEIQNGIIDKLKVFILFDNKIKIAKKEILENLNKFGNKPSLYDIERLKKLEFYDNGKFHYLVEPLSIVNFKENFLNTKWKTAYLKQCFRFNLPYDKVIVWTRERVDIRGKS